MYFVRMPLWLFVILLPFIVWASPAEDRLAVLGGAALIVGVPLVWAFAKRRFDAYYYDSSREWRRVHRDFERQMRRPGERERFEAKTKRVQELTDDGYSYGVALKAVEAAEQRIRADGGPMPGVGWEVALLEACPAAVEPPAEGDYPAWLLREREARIKGRPSQNLTPAELRAKWAEV